MNKKIKKYCFLVLTICFILLGLMCGIGAENQKGLTIRSSGSVGTIGAHPKEYESFKFAQGAFYVMGGISGVLCVFYFVTDRNS